MNRRKLVIRKIPFLQYLYIYIAIQFVGGRIQDALGDIFIGAALVMALIVIAGKRAQWKTDSAFFTFVVLMTALMAVTVFFTRGGLSIASCLSLLTRFFIVYSAMAIDRRYFEERLLKMCYLFAWVSLILYAFVLIFGTETAIQLLFSHLYEQKSRNIWMMSSYGLFLICYNFIDPTRNAYMFGEAGEYQMVIMLALYFLVFKTPDFLQNDKKLYRKYLIVFLITMFTIQSTSGFFILAIFAVCVLGAKSNRVPKNVKRAVSVGIVGLVAYFMFSGNSSHLYRVTLSKLFNEAGKFDLAASTGADRMKSILDLFDIAKRSPQSLIFGVGYSGMIVLRGGFSASGIVNTIVMFGIFTCLLLYGYIDRMIYKYSAGLYEFLFLLSMIIVNGLSQPDLLAITTVIVTVYGPICFAKTRLSEESPLEKIDGMKT